VIARTASVDQANQGLIFKENLYNSMKINLLHSINILLRMFVATFPILVTNACAQVDSHKSVIDKYSRELIRQRDQGPILVSVPVAYVFGLGGDRSPLYCSPSVRAANGSNKVIEELIVGITYRSAAGTPAGSSVSRFTNIKVKRIESHFFNQLETSKCSGLTGELNVVRCVYTTGEDCSHEIQAINFGAIPLQLRTKHSGEKP
jgi:hypothetical protein